jgi:hypothetical protein
MEVQVKRVLVFLLLGLILVLAMSSVAMAAGTSPQDIYNDWLAHGSLTGQYTNAQLEAYLNDPTVHMYGDSAVLKPLDSYVTSTINSSGRSTFPWTGAQIAAIAGAAVLLIGLGVLLRRSAKHKQQSGE